ncbi:MAG: integrase core domain-containing protein [Nitrospira sp.]|nr:integrase core domain-containing protein [Nitrospira sp.]
MVNREIFYTMHEAQISMDRRRQQYNTLGPHSALGH